LIDHHFLKHFAMYVLTAFDTIEVARVAIELPMVDRMDLLSTGGAPIANKDGGGSETTNKVLRTTPKPTKDATATERIGFARTYSFQSTSRFASP
jgi:hypothetical protein